MTISFDVDFTLIDSDNSWNENVLKLLKWFVWNGDRVIIWSGGGLDYATLWRDRLQVYLDIKGLLALPKLLSVAKEYDVDVAVDDEFVELGKVNLKITNFSKMSYN